MTQSVKELNFCQCRIINYQNECSSGCWQGRQCSFECDHSVYMNKFRGKGAIRVLTNWSALLIGSKVLLLVYIVSCNHLLKFQSVTIICCCCFSVKVQGVMEQHRVSSVLQSRNFRRHLENIIRGSISTVRQSASAASSRTTAANSSRPETPVVSDFGRSRSSSEESVASRAQDVAVPVVQPAYMGTFWKKLRDTAHSHHWSPTTTTTNTAKYGQRWLGAISGRA